MRFCVVRFACLSTLNLVDAHAFNPLSFTRNRTHTWLLFPSYKISPDSFDIGNRNIFQKNPTDLWQMECCMYARMWLNHHFLPMFTYSIRWFITYRLAIAIMVHNFLSLVRTHFKINFHVYRSTLRGFRSNTILKYDASVKCGDNMCTWNVSLALTNSTTFQMKYGWCRKLKFSPGKFNVQCYML